MRKNRKLYNGLVILAFISVLSVALFTDTIKANATPDLSIDGKCTECHIEMEENNESQQTAEPAQINESPQPTPTASPSPVPTPFASPSPSPVPTPPEPAPSQSPSLQAPAQPAETNNSLLIGGLVAGVVIIGGVAWMLKRKK